MPELAEVEYYRRQWDAGVGAKVARVHIHAEKRVFLGTDTTLVTKLAGKVLERSEASGKQMLFKFGQGYWLGIHLGMTGKLSTESADYTPQKHDHLVLFQKERALVFNDMRQFGRIRIEQSKQAPDWWQSIGTAVTSAEFTQELMKDFLGRHGRLAVKAVLLNQKAFPGIGNWMADEILWRAGITPGKICAELTNPEQNALWKESRFVAREAIRKIGKDFGDPPRTWLFHERWKRAGNCPKHKSALKRETIGGRTTAWCPKCQH